MTGVPLPSPAFPPPAGTRRPGGRFLFRLASALPLALLLLGSVANLAPGGEGNAVVVEVVDGDTVRVRSGGIVSTVRMIGIDAPERGHPSRPREFVADEAADALSAMCMGKPVRLERDREDVDKYGRLLRYVHTADGRVLLNREMLRKGMARVYRRFPFSRRAEFEAAEASARREGLGVWRNGGLDELRWARIQGQEPVSVWRLGGGGYGIAAGGVGKGGIGETELQAEIAQLARLRAELSDADFAEEARKHGYGRIGADRAPATAKRAIPPAKPAPPGAVVPWDRAHEFLGQAVTVEGTVVRTKRSRKTVFLNFHDNWKRYLTVVLFTGRLPGLPDAPETFYRGRKIRVRGTVKLYKDRPEIVVESASDIRLVP